MGKITLLDMLKVKIGDLAFKIFLWSNNITKDRYLDQVYEEEKEYRKMMNEYDVYYPQYKNED